MVWGILPIMKMESSESRVARSATLGVEDHPHKDTVMGKLLPGVTTPPTLGEVIEGKVLGIAKAAVLARERSARRTRRSRQCYEHPHHVPRHPVCLGVRAR